MKYRIKNRPIDKDLLVELIEERIIVEYRDSETGKGYYSLTPQARRALYKLPDSTEVKYNHE